MLEYNSTNKYYSAQPKTNPKDRVIVEVGDSKDPSVFQPQVKLMRWENEVNTSIRLKHNNITGTVSYSDDGTKVTWQKGQWKAVFYERDDVEDGGFEFEIHIPKKPPINYLEFTVNTKDLNWFYQPALTQAEIDNGCSRPENVVGSYAVYHKHKRGVQTAGGMEYKTGKAFHVYRPHVVDANGNETWGTFSLDTASGTLRLTVDQAWLNSAAYPVIVDPTFGYTGTGSSTETIASYTSDWAIRSGTGGPLMYFPSSGTITSLSAALKLSGTTSESIDTCFFINTENTSTDSHTQVDYAEELNKAYTNTTYSFFTINAHNASVSSGSTYILSAVGNGGDIATSSANLQIAFDNGSEGAVTHNAYIETFQGGTGDQNYANAKESPWTETDASSTRLHSIYATFAPTASSTVTERFFQTTTWTAPTGVSSITVKAWGGGGGGWSATNDGGAGGGGGGYSASTVAVTASSSYTVTVGAGGNGGSSATAGGDSEFIGNDKTVLAKGGTAATARATPGIGGSSSSGTGDTKYSGGNGGQGNTSDGGGGGGGAGGPDGNGVTGSNSSGGAGANGGAGDNSSGGAGGAGGTTGENGGNGGFSFLGGGGGGGAANYYYGGQGGIPGGGGGGSERQTGYSNYGATGMVEISYTAPSGGYTLTAAQGSFTLTGQATTLTVARTIAAAQGTFTLTGYAADLLEGSGYYFTVDVGSYTLTGNATALQKGYLVTAVQGSHTLTGQNAGLLTTRTLSAEQGSYSLTGQDATLTKSSATKLTADYGTFAITGQAATITVQHTLSAEQGTFTITGQATGTTTTRTLAGDVQTYTVTGEAATITTGRTITAAYGSFTLTGQDATLSKYSSYMLIAEAGSFTLSGQTAGITATRTIGAEHGTYTLTGYGATTTRTVLLSAGQGSFSITGLDTAILRTSLLSPEVGNYTLAGQGSALLVSRNISAGQGAYTLTGEDAQFSRLCVLTAENATYTLSPQAAAILGTFILQTDVQTYTLTGYGAVITQAGVSVVLSKKGKIVLSTHNTKMPLLTKTQRTKLFNRQTDIVC